MSYIQNVEEANVEISAFICCQWIGVQVFGIASNISEF